METDPRTSFRPALWAASGLGQFMAFSTKSEAGAHYPCTTHTNIHTLSLSLSLSRDRKPNIPFSPCPLVYQRSLWLLMALSNGVQKDNGQKRRLEDLVFMDPWMKKKGWVQRKSWISPPWVLEAWAPSVMCPTLFCIRGENNVCWSVLCSLSTLSVCKSSPYRGDQRCIPYSITALVLAN